MFDSTKAETSFKSMFTSSRAHSLLEPAPDDAMEHFRGIDIYFLLEPLTSQLRYFLCRSHSSWSQDVWQVGSGFQEPGKERGRGGGRLGQAEVDGRRDP